MSTARDLLLVAMDMPSTRPLERGDLSLALAGAELVDLLGAEVVKVTGGRIVPESADPPEARDAEHTGEVGDDHLLDEAVLAVHRTEPHETVEEWLWRRGRGLAEVYLARLEAEGQLVRKRQRRWGVFRTNELVLVDSAARQWAGSRWRAEEPVLADLATGVGIRDQRSEEAPKVTDPAVENVLHAVTEALSELSEERQRRARRLNDAAVDNYRRGY